MTARDQVSADANGGCSGCGEATPEHSRLFVAGFGSAATSFPPSAVKDFEAERGLHVGIAAAASFATSADFDAVRDSLRVGFASEP
jgi:hypothetical protein